MSLIRTADPEDTPISLDEAKNYARVDTSEDDALLTGFIEAATERLDGRDGLLGRCLLTQTWCLKLDCFSGVIAVPLPPCQSISSIGYVDSDGVTQTLAAESYQVAGIGDPAGAKVRPAFGRSWPSTRKQPEAVTVTFVAGYGDEPEDVPEPIRRAILEQVASMYDGRDVDDGGSDLPEILTDYRTWSF